MRASLRIFRWAALGLATVGLALLFAVSRHREIPLVRVGNVTRTMNFAYVRLEGEVLGDARIYRNSGRVESLRFVLRDDTGDISVRAQRDRARWLVDHHMVPDAGDRVEVVGTLNIGSEQDAVLWLQWPERMRVTRVELPVTPIGAIRAEDADHVFRVTGHILAVRPPRSDSRAPWVIEIRDESGSAPLVFFKDVYEEITNRTDLAPGVRIEARVTASIYRGSLQLALRRGTDLRMADTSVDSGRAPSSLLSPATAADEETPILFRTAPLSDSTQPSPAPVASRTIAIRDISSNLEGQMVRVVGRVREVHPPRAESRAPWRWVLDEEDAAIEVVYWSAVASQLKGDAIPAPRRRVEITAKVELWRSTPQLRVERADQIRWLSEAPPPGEEASP